MLPGFATSRSRALGLSLVELLIGIAITSIAIAIAISQMGNISSLFSSMRAEASARTEMSQAADSVKTYFQSKWKGGAFECSATPKIGEDAYCIKSSDCVSGNANAFEKCRSFAIIRGDPADSSTNPDRVRVTTRCEPATGARQKNLAFDSSLCGLSCPAGTYPLTTIEVTRPGGTTRTVTYPGGVAAGREIVGDAELRGAELCLTKKAGSGLVTIDAQGYYIFGKDLKTVRKQVSTTELTTTNTNIEYLP